jgi:FKBP-type peptidyl-prolyl cis-trans isomerase
MKEAGEEFQKLSRENKIKGQEFLDENKTKEGVLVRRSNLQYKTIVIGTGDIPDYDDEVTVHYSGYFIDGQKFDSSYDRNTPATFPVQKVIPGWTEILQMMPVGSKWEVYIPYNLGYGKSGVPGQEMGTFVIPPASVLIFEIELLGIVK